MDEKKTKYSPMLWLKLSVNKVIVNFDSIFQQFLHSRLSIEHVVEHFTHAEEKIRTKRVRQTINKPLMLRTESVHSNSVTTLPLLKSVA